MSRASSQDNNINNSSNNNAMRDRVLSPPTVVLELSATQYLPAPLPSNLLNFMEGKTRIAGEISVVPRHKADIRYRHGVMEEKAPPMDHELVQYKTIKRPTKKRHKHKPAPTTELPTLTTSSVVKSQSSPEWIRHQHLQEFYVVREHHNVIAELARQNIFQSSLTDDNEVVLPWKSPFRNPKKVKKPKSPYRLDEPKPKNQVYSEKSSAKSSKSSAAPQVTNYTPLLLKTKEISYRDRLALENYQLINPSHNSSQSVYSSFLSLPEGHIYTDNGKPPVSKVDTTKKKPRKLLDSKQIDMTALRASVAMDNEDEDDNMSLDSQLTDSTTKPKGSSNKKVEVSNASSVPIAPAATTTVPISTTIPFSSTTATNNRTSTVDIPRPPQLQSVDSVVGPAVKHPLIRIAITSNTPSSAVSSPTSYAPGIPMPGHNHRVNHAPVPNQSPIGNRSSTNVVNNNQSPLIASQDHNHHHHHYHHHHSPAEATRPRSKPHQAHLFRSPSPPKDRSPEPRSALFTSVGATVTEIDNRVRYLYGSPSAAVNLNSPPGYPSTDESIRLRMFSAPSLGAPGLPQVAPPHEVKTKAAEVAEDESSQESESLMNDEDDELNSLSTESKVDHQPLVPPKMQAVGHLEFADSVTQFTVSGVHYTLPPNKLELTMAQKAKARDAQVKKLSDSQLAQAEKIRLQRLVDEFGLEEANKIEGMRRWRQAKKQQLKSQAPIYALSKAGCALVSRRLARTDAVPMVGIVKDCKWKEDWPTATAGPARSIEIFDGVAVVTATGNK